jgi:hypothetical protein
MATIAVLTLGALSIVGSLLLRNYAAAGVTSTLVAIALLSTFLVGRHRQKRSSSKERDTDRIPPEDMRTIVVVGIGFLVVTAWAGWWTVNMARHGVIGATFLGVVGTVSGVWLCVKGWARIISSRRPRGSR